MCPDREAMAVLRNQLIPVAVLAAAVAMCGCSDRGKAMARAIDSGDLPEVKRLTAPDARLVNASVTSDIGMSQSMLQLAVDDRRYAMARFLVSKGACLESQDSLGRRPLWTAVGNDDPAMVRLLLRAGADPNARGPGGGTALHEAASGGDKALVALLLSRGADPSLADASGKIPTYYALKNGHFDAARLLQSRAEVGRCQ